MAEPSDRCYRCGKTLDEIADDIVVDLVETMTFNPQKSAVTVPIKVKEKRHQRCPWRPAPSPFDDYPKKPGRGWMSWACVTLGLDDKGTHAEVAARLQREGFDIEQPSDEPINYSMPKAGV